jgi:hypothetical protein
MNPHILILICSLMLKSDECDQDSARAVIIGPVSTNGTCGLYDQSAISGTEIRPTKDEYIKVICGRRLTQR